MKELKAKTLTVLAYMVETEQKKGLSVIGEVYRDKKRNYIVIMG